MLKQIKVPRYYEPWPHQIVAWNRRRKNIYRYDVKLWARQLGKDSDDIEWNLDYCWRHPGLQSVYIGLDNIWIRDNIFKKIIDGRSFWMDYPEEYLDVKATQREVYFANNPEDSARARIKFLGFLNDQAAIGSSYDMWTISEASLYDRGAFQFIEPIWDRKIKMGNTFMLNMNGTPRGMHNVFYDFLRTYTKEDDPEKFPGEHGDCYVHKVTIEDALIPDGNGGWKPLYSPQELEELEDRYLRAYGNLNLYRQENYCDFLTVNAGLVYLAIEQLVKENRYCKLNLDTSRPVYFAWDISSKDKQTDATSAIIYQYYNGQMFIYDIYESRGKALVDCVAELSQRPYFQYIRFGVLPWDSERSASSEAPIDEVRRVFPQINWHALSKERVDRGIQAVRNQMPNMLINSDNCEYLLECFNNYEYKRLSKSDDWAAKPAHSKYSHLMDALRYSVMGIHEMDYFQLNDDGSDNLVAGYYGGFDSPTYADEPKRNIWERRERKSDGGVLFYS